MDPKVNSFRPTSVTRKLAKPDLREPATKDTEAALPSEKFKSSGPDDRPNLMHQKMMIANVGGAASVVGGAALVAGAGLAAAMAAPAMTMGLGMIGGAVVGAMASLGSATLSKEFINNYKVAKEQRTRNADGRFRQKSGKTQLDTLRETYGPNFAAGLPGNMPLQVVRAATGMSLTKLVQNPDKIAEKKEELGKWKAPEPAPGGRTRNADGKIRQKRGDTKVDTLRKSYGMDFAAQLPGNWPLAIIREATGMSLTELTSNPEKLQDALPKIAAKAIQMEEALDLKGHKEGIKAKAEAIDQVPDKDVDPSPGRVSTPKDITGRSMTASMPSNSFITRVDRPLLKESVSHTPASDGTTMAILQKRDEIVDILNRKKPVATDLIISYHDNGKIESIRDISRK